MRKSVGSTKPKGGMKVKVPLVGGSGGIPWLCWGRTTGPSGRLPPVPLGGAGVSLRSGGARAYTLGPERW